MGIRKIISLVLLIPVTIALIGCGNQNEKPPQKKSPTTNTTQNAENYDKGYLEIKDEEIEGMDKMSCTREATGKGDSKVKLNYTLYYQGEYLQLLHSKEEILTQSQDILDEYQTAYINIYKHYENLEHYNTSVIRTKNSVTNDTIINYNKIDTDKLLEIEGTEDNIIKDGKVKLDDWLNFAEQFGTTCEKN